jgi:hypothetical protein
MAPSTSEARRAAAALLLLLAATSGAAQDAYPTDITPPPGTRYPCALTALPRGLPGIPEADRAYVNHTYSRLLRATQAKLVLLKAIEEPRGIEPALTRYRDTTRGLAARQGSEAVPVGLEPFQADVLGALELQQIFFAKAAALRQSGRGMDAVYGVREGREASARLIAAWSRMQGRYPGWPPATRDSIYHHLCALDLF